MRTIYKYQLGAPGRVLTQELPRGVVPLHFADQHGTPTLWALVDDEQPTEQWSFILVGTGWPLTEEVRAEDHLGTIQLEGFVWHLFGRRV